MAGEPKRVEGCYRKVELGELLEAMRHYGLPRVFACRYSGGWCCKVNLRVPYEGASGEVQSEFGHPSPEAAAIECWHRLQKAVGARGYEVQT